MRLLTPQLKDMILRQYRPFDRNNSFAALARRYDIRGGKRTVHRWYMRWKQTPDSLEQKRGAGRPRLLSAAQIRDTITLPIRNRNRAHRAVSYPQLLPTVREQTGTEVSLRTIKRYGKEVAKVHDMSTRSMTGAECKYTATISYFNA